MKYRYYKTTEESYDIDYLHNNWPLGKFWRHFMRCKDIHSVIEELRKCGHEVYKID